MNEYDIGDQPVATATFRDVDDVLTNPSTVVFKTRTPSGVETTYTSPNANITNPSVGVWKFTFPAAVTEAGNWVVRARGTAGLLAAEESTFIVRRSRFGTP